MAIGMFADLSRVGNGEQVLYDNGAHFIYVDRSCRYWATMQQARGEVTSGTLTPEDIAYLRDVLLFQEWWEWAGVWIPGEWVWDAGVTVLYPAFTQEAAVVCYSLCASAPAPAELGIVHSLLGPFIQSLWQSGEPISGGVRMTARRWSDGGGALVNPVFDWPATSFRLADVAIPYGTAPPPAYGQGILVTGGDATALRALRAQYFAAAAVDWSVEVRDDTGARYSVFIRDTLPFENQDGLVRPN